MGGGGNLGDWGKEGKAEMRSVMGLKSFNGILLTGIVVVC